MKILSISIPTYNRADKLEQTLSCLINQIIVDNLSDDVEIVVSDNASTDMTPHVCENNKFQSGNVRLVYSRNSENVGFDRNVDRAIRISNSVYVWTLSDDDVIYPGAVKQILDAVRSRDLQFAFVNYEVLVNDRIIPSRYGSGALAEIPARDVLARISFSNSLISSCVFKREAWVRSLPERFFGSLWIHFHMAAAVLLSGNALILGRPLFAQKQDSLERSRAERKNADTNSVEFYMQAHLNFLAFVATLRANGHSYATAQHADRIARREDVHQVINYKLTTDCYAPIQIARTWQALGRYRSDSAQFWLLLTPMLLMPGSLYRLARSLRRRMRS